MHTVFYQDKAAIERTPLKNKEVVKSKTDMKTRTMKRLNKDKKAKNENHKKFVA
jgi:hypothetical protein